MGTNNTQKILASADMTASDVENAIRKRDVKAMVIKQLGDKVVKLGFREKKPHSNLVTVIEGIEADVLTWQKYDGESEDR